jgi:hypothetical protein
LTVNVARDIWRERLNMAGYLTYQVELIRKQGLLSTPARRALHRFIGSEPDPVDLIADGVSQPTRDIVDLLALPDDESRWLGRWHYWEKRRLEEIESYPWAGHGE